MSVAVAARVQELLEQNVGRDIPSLAWDFVDEPATVRELYAVYRRSDPSLAIDSSRLKFLEEEQYRREGKVFRRELYETVEALGATGARFTAYFVAHADFAPFALALGRLGDARAVPALTSRLGASGELLAAVIDALGHLGAATAVPELIQLASSSMPAAEREQTEHRRIVANACLALGRIGDPRAMPVLLSLVTEPPPDMDSVIARAIVGLGWLGDGQATHALLRLLDGRHRNVAMYALARIADRGSASHVEAVAARLVGTKDQLVYPRLMLEALRSRLGRSVDLDVVRHALRVFMANRFEARELHETALRLLAVHAPPDELLHTARRFVDAEHSRVRTAAANVLGSVGIVVKPNFLDRPRVDALFRREGVRGLVGALRDPDAIFRHNAIRKGADAECGAELEVPALAAVRTMVAFPSYSEVTVADRSEATFDALEALARFHTPGADAFLISLFDHENAMVRASAVDIARVDVYGASERVREALRSRVVAPGAARPTLPAARLGGGPWVFGPPVRELAGNRAGSRFAALGETKVTLFDADGTAIGGRDDLENASAMTFDRAGDRLAVACENGYVVLFDARSGELAGSIRLIGAKAVSSIVVASDGDVVVGTRAGLLQKGSRDVVFSRKLEGPVLRMVAHPDRPLILVLAGERVYWIDERDGAVCAASPKSRPKAKAKKVPARPSPILDLAFHREPNLVAILRPRAVEWLDGVTLASRGSVAVAGGVRVAWHKDGATLLVAVGGKSPGLLRVDVAAKAIVQTVRASGPIAALVLDPLSALALTGGAGVRVELWEETGHSSTLPIAQHTERVLVMLTDAARARAFSFGADAMVLQWDAETREIVAGWRTTAEKGGLVGAVVGATGRTLLAAWQSGVTRIDLVSGTAVGRALPLRGVSSMARAGSHVWVAADNGLFSVVETAGRANRISLPRAVVTKGSLLASLDDTHFACVHGRKIWVINAVSLSVSKPLVLASPVTHVAGGVDMALVVVLKNGDIARLGGTPLAVERAVRGPGSALALSFDEVAERVAVSAGQIVTVFDRELDERARVRLEHGVSTMAFADRGLLFCGGVGGEVSVIETVR